MSEGPLSRFGDVFDPEALNTPSGFRGVDPSLSVNLNLRCEKGPWSSEEESPVSVDPWGDGREGVSGTGYPWSRRM